MKRIGSFLMALVLCLTLLPVGMVSASAGPMSLSELREKYPHGAYWNHSGNTVSDYTWNPCTHHRGECSYSGSCGCNTYKGVAIQCMGYAYQLASLAYDCDPRTEWSTNYATSALNKLKPGDIVRYRNNGHSLFVIGVDGENVTYADANSDNGCQIKWDRTTTKANLKATFTYVKAAPYALPQTNALTIQYHGGGGDISAPITGYRYIVTDASGVNLRKNAGTGNTVLTALPKGTEFTVNKGNTKTANGYTWGKTTYNGTTGWLVISDFVEQIGTLREGEHYLSENVVYYTASSAPVVRTAFQEEKVMLDNPATFNLEKPGYRFLGWSTKANGADPVYSWEDTTLTAETLCPALAQGNASVTLYAVWGCIHQYADPCADACSQCGEKREVVHRYVNACDPNCDLCGAERVVTHDYATACSETCTICGAGRGVTSHTFVENVCTVCGKETVTLAITTPLKNGYAPIGERVRVKVEAEGEGLTYRWFVKNVGETKYIKSSVTAATYSTVMSPASKNRRVLCYVYDRYGNKIQSNSVLLRESVSITTQPKSAKVAKGTMARSTVVASGDGLRYVWFVRNADQTKYTKSSLTTATYSVKMSEKVNGRRLICYVYDKYGNKVQAQTVILRMK